MDSPAGRAVALITGGGRGLGLAIGQRLASQGVAVGLLARTRDEVDEAARSIQDGGGLALGLVADVLDRPALDRAVDRFADWGGRLDAIVCAAGTLRAIGPLTGVSGELIGHDVMTGLLGVPATVQAAWPLLEASQRPTISVLVGPGHERGLPFASSYAMAQAGLLRLVESLAEELRPSGVSVYAINPGLVPTALVHHLLDSPEGRRWLPRFTEAFAEGKEVGPGPVAEMVAWLVATRPPELSGRLIAAPLPPAILETRIDRIVANDLGRLRVR